MELDATKAQNSSSKALPQNKRVVFPEIIYLCGHVGRWPSYVDKIKSGIDLYPDLFRICYSFIIPNFMLVSKCARFL